MKLGNIHFMGALRQIFILSFILVCLPSFSTAQYPLKLSATVGGGLLLPQSSNLKGNIYSVYDYPLSKNNYNLSGKIRFGLPVLPFTIIGTVSYNSLYDNAILPYQTTTGIVHSKYTSSLIIISSGIGIEYSFLRLPIISPYVSSSAVMNYFSGRSGFDDILYPENKLNSTSRFGIDLGAGTTIDIPRFPFSLDLEVKYHFANVSGKDFGGSGGANGFGGLPQTTSYNLNDAKNPNDPNDHDRSINYFTITLGFNITIL